MGAWRWRQAYGWAAGALLVWGGAVSVPALSPPPGVLPEDTHAVVWHVVEVGLTDTNAVRWGTNCVAVVDVTNQLGVFGAGVDAVVIHGGRSDADLRVSPEVLEQIVRTGKSVFVDDGAPEATADPAAGGVRSVTIRSGYLKFLRPAESAGAEAVTNAPRVAVSSTITIDTDRGLYQLREVGVGFWDERLWLVHELPEDESQGSIGLKYKKTW